MLVTVFNLPFTQLFLMLHPHTPENISSSWVPNAIMGHRNVTLQRDKSKLYWPYMVSRNLIKVAFYTDNEEPVNM